MQARPLNVLIIEDNPMDFCFVEEIFNKVEGKQYELVSTETLSGGLEYLAEGIEPKAGGPKVDFDIVLLDLNLPDSEGRDTFLAINKKAERIPIVIFTSIDDEDLAIKLLREGAQDYLIKGTFKKNNLLRTIRYACERAKLRWALRDNEAQLYRLIKNMGSTLVVDKNGIIVFSNLAAEVFFNRGFDTSAEGDQSARIGSLINTKFEHPLEDGCTNEIEVTFEGEDTRTAEMCTALIEWKEEQAYLVAIHDITIHKMIEAELKEKIKELEQTIEELKG